MPVTRANRHCIGWMHPMEYFRLITGEQTRRFVSAVKEHDGFTFVAIVQPAESRSKVVLLSVDDSGSSKSTFLRLCYHNPLQALLLDYNNVTNSLMAFNLALEKRTR
jgi:hypothetical protein